MENDSVNFKELIETSNIIASGMLTLKGKK